MKKFKSPIFKRIFSLVCALAMLVSFIPAVSAADPDDEPGKSNVPRAETRPTINSGWDNARTLDVAKVVRNTGATVATGKANVLYDDENLYIRVKVTDSDVNNASAEAYLADSVEFILSEMNHRGSYNATQANQYRLTNKGAFSSKSSTPTTQLIQSEAWRRVAQHTDYGYDIFLAIPLQYNNGPLGNETFAFDIQINDATTPADTRTGEITWYDSAANGYNSTAGCGSLILLPYTGPDRQFIIATAGANGKITPSSRVWVLSGEDKTFTITPNPGYVVDDVSVNGESVGAVGTYTFTSVTGNENTISATFKDDPGAAVLPFIMRNESYGTGELTVAAIIDLGEGKSADGSSLTKDMFNVTARNTRSGDVNDVRFSGSRNITKVYASDVNDYGTPSDTGRYIVLELEFYGPGGDKMYGGYTADGGYSLVLNYSVTNNAPISLTGGETLNNIRLYQDGVVSPVIDKYTRVTEGTGQSAITYMQYLNEETEGPLPVVIYFHGSGGGGDAWAPIREGNGGTMWAYPENQAKYPCHVLAPQGTSGASWPVNRIQAMGNVVKRMIAEGLVDPNRVYVTGFSMGGTGTIQFLNEFPELAAAAVPVAMANAQNAALNPANAAKYADVPIWFFVHEGDGPSWGATSNWISYNVMNLFRTEGNHVPDSVPNANLGVGVNVLKKAKLTVTKTNKTYVYPFTGWEGVSDDGVMDFPPHSTLPFYNNPMQYLEPEWVGKYDYLIDWVFAQSKADGPVLEVTTDAHLVKKGGYFHVTASFAEEVKSNTAVLNYDFDTAKFDYRGFTPAEGSSVVSAEKTDTGVKIILMIPDYKTLNYGEVLLSAKEDVDLENKDNEIKLYVDYVVLNEQDEKEVRNASASTTFTSTDDRPGTGEDGEVTLIDLSNMIDLFGMDKTSPDWEKYRFYDYNNNGAIDIHDISTLASRIK